MKSETNRAIVTRSTGSNYRIRDLGSGQPLDARIRGKLKLRGVRTTNPVAVGDIVEYESDQFGSYLITDIEQRKNYIIRRSPNLSREAHIIAANLDQALLITTIADPPFNPEFVDRFLVTCEAYDVPAGIVFNKTDLIEGYEEALEYYTAVYHGAGYPVYHISALRCEGVDELRELLQDKITLLSGNSGTGKSTLINCLVPGADVKTAGISDYHRKGRHTTTFATMYPLPGGGDIIDTPGIKGFGLIDIDREELNRYFPEIMEVAPRCQFYNCTHIHEPGCAVTEAVGQGRIAESRYIGYLKIMEEDGKYR